MNIEEFREFCLHKAGTEEAMPFDDQVLVFKVAGKMFALCDIDGFESVNLKCDPQKSIELRAEFPGIKPGYHMNKKHWNTIEMNGSVPFDLVIKLINHSYDLVVAGLPLYKQKQLKSDESSDRSSSH